MSLSAAVVRKEIENALSKRVPSALTPQARSMRPVTATGIAELDQQLRGGVPSAAITELVGPESSGRTTVALSLLAGVIAASNVCAWIDVTDSLDPESAAASGVDLERLLWVRCSQGEKVSLAKRTDEQPAPLAIADVPFQPRHAGGGSPHPRSESRDMPGAVSALLQSQGGSIDSQERRERKKLRTPGMPNRPLSQQSPHREEQVNSDRLPARRGDNLKLLHLPVRTEVQQPAAQGKRRSDFKPRWHALDQALRATDILLHSGGFNVIVLDLGSVAPEQVWRIPLATWFRYRAACESTRATLLLLTQHSCAKTSAELVLRLGNGRHVAESKVLTGVCYSAFPERHRFQPAAASVVPIRKPPQSERSGQWSGKAAWCR